MRIAVWLPVVEQTGSAGHEKLSIRATIAS